MDLESEINFKQNRKRIFRISSPNIAIYNTTRRIIFVYYSILQVVCKLKYCSIDSSVEIYHRGFSNQFEKLVFAFFCSIVNRVRENP